MLLRNWIALGALLILTACASATLKKVPAPTQYLKWTDAMQREADSIEGIRFYLPRPFVNVFESFPVRTDIYLADGKVSPDGRYVYIERIRLLGQDWKEIAKFAGAGVVKIPRTVISQPSPEAARALGEAMASKIQPHSAEESATSEIEKLKAQLAERDKKIQDLTAASESETGKTGQLTQTVKNDNSAVAYQPLRGNFDIAYLPDFEEQYAVKTTTGLGNVRVAVNMGQGWSLQGLDALTDNSELNKRIFGLIDEATKLGKAAASAALGLPPGVASMITPQAGEELPEAAAGTPVTLRLVVVHYAAKGLYPVLKPRELQQRTVSGAASYQYAVDCTSAGVPKPASLYSPQELMKGQRELDESIRSMTIPRYPYQYISFNTFQYIAIEAVTPSSPFGALYDKTGTAGDPGDRQAADLADVLRMLASGASGGGDTADLAKNLKRHGDDLAKRINAQCGSSTGAPAACRGYEAQAATLGFNDSTKVLTVSVALKKAPSTRDDAAFAKQVKQIAERLVENFKDVTVADPTVTGP